MPIACLSDEFRMQIIASMLSMPKKSLHIFCPGLFQQVQLIIGVCTTQKTESRADVASCKLPVATWDSGSCMPRLKFFLCVSFDAIRVISQARCGNSWSKRDPDIRVCYGYTGENLRNLSSRELAGGLRYFPVCFGYFWAPPSQTKNSSSRILLVNRLLANEMKVETSQTHTRIARNEKWVWRANGITN